MFQVIDSIPNKMPDNKDVQMMVNYINETIRINNMEVMILQRKEGVIVVPTKLYNEDEIYTKNIFTYWQRPGKRVIELSILPELNPQKNKAQCQFSTIKELEGRNIAKMIYAKYEDLLNKR